MTMQLELHRHVFLSRNNFMEHYLNCRPVPLHLVFFWIGFVFNTTGTGIMFNVAGGMQNDIHGWTGMFAIILMFIHTIWASIVLLRKDEKMIVSFHKFSVGVWVIWLIPYLSDPFFPGANTAEVVFKTKNTQKFSVFHVFFEFNDYFPNRAKQAEEIFILCLRSLFAGYSQLATTSTPGRGKVRPGLDQYRPHDKA